MVYCLIKLLEKSALAICLCVQYFCRIIFFYNVWSFAATIIIIIIIITINAIYRVDVITIHNCFRNLGVTSTFQGPGG